MRTGPPLRRTLPLLASLWLLAVSCALIPGAPRPPTPEARADYEAAVELLARDRSGGVVRLEAFLRDWPRSSLADDAALVLARTRAEAGEDDAAVQPLLWSTRVHPRGDRADEARLLLAKLERRRGNVEAAYRAATRIRMSRLSATQRREAQRLLADLSGDRGDPAGQLAWLERVRADALDPEEKTEVDAEIDSIVARIPRSDLDHTADQLRQRSPAARIHLRMAEIALSVRDVERARRHLREASRFELSREESERFTELEMRLSSAAAGGDGAARLPSFLEAARAGVPSTHDAAGTLAAVLPLSGPFAGFGEECLQGILLAAGVFDADGAGPQRLRVAVRDSGGDADRAAAAVDELADDGDVSAIVGPLLGSEVEAAADAADDRGLPLLALSARSEVASTRPRVFRVGRSPRAEVQVLVGFALEELGLGRFAIFYPDDPYGRGLKDLFWDSVEAQGGRVAGVASYDPESTDFADAIRGLVGYRMLTEEEAELLEEREEMMDRAKKLPAEEARELREEARALLGPEGQPLPPVVNFDAVFIPDSHEKVTLIAPQLAFHEVNDVRLLGPNGWYHPDLVRIGGKHVDGAVFTETFFPDSEIPFVAEFTSRYEAAFGKRPGALAALAYDAANLVLVQLARGLHSRNRVREGLLSVEAYPGVSGVTTILADGNAQKRPYLLGVQGRRIRSLEPARIE